MSRCTSASSSSETFNETDHSADHSVSHSCRMLEHVACEERSFGHTLGRTVISRCMIYLEVRGDDLCDLGQLHDDGPILGVVEERITPLSG